jgi:hypothetical protein
VSCHQVMSSTFEFLHNCCHKFPSGAYKGGGGYVLKSSYPLCCGFLHLFHVSVFGIVNSLLRGRETYKNVCLQATSHNKHKLV